MFSIEQFIADYENAPTPDAKWDVLKKGVNAFSVQVGMVTAHFMESVDEEKYAEAAALALDLGVTLQNMAGSLNMVAIVDKMRKAEGR